jgi:hypothetical protein
MKLHLADVERIPLALVEPCDEASIDIALLHLSLLIEPLLVTQPGPDRAQSDEF